MSASTTSAQVGPDAGHVFTLRDYLERLRAGRNLILACLIVVPVVSLALSLLQSSLYRSETEILVKPLPVGEAAGLVTAPVINMETERQLVYSNPVLQGALDRLDRDQTAKAFANSVDVLAVPQTELLVIGVTSPDPREARDAADALASSYLEFRAEQARKDLQVVSGSLEGQLDLVQDQIEQIDAELAASQRALERTRGSARQLRLLVFKQLLKEKRSASIEETGIRRRLAQVSPERAVEAGVGTIVEPAQLSTAPVSPRPLRNLIFGALAGLLLGVVLVLILFSPAVRDQLARPPRR